MRRAAPGIVLGLALLLVIALWLRGEPREESPRRAPRRSAPVPVAEAAAPAESAPRAPATPPPPEAVAPVPATALPGTVRGLVKIRGPIPARKMIRFNADRTCERIHAGGSIPMDDLVADATGNVQWAFVYVKSGPIAPPQPPPAVPVLMDQSNCIFTPHVVGIRVGQPLRVLNSDELLHNVHVVPLKNKETNVGLPHAGLEYVRTFDAPEVMVRIQCVIHPWMRCWIGVLDHPHFSITNEIGSYTIPELPAGKYSLEVWHEKCDPVARLIEVPSGGDVRLDFLLDLKK